MYKRDKNGCEAFIFVGRYKEFSNIIRSDGKYYVPNYYGNDNYSWTEYNEYKASEARPRNCPSTFIKPVHWLYILSGNDTFRRDKK